ncbi:hypothetical protein BDV59DRAFT_200717 [Aspergillus ambiguus]|uniref:uncharacterized protein n=1 Tax=Aspergillus ambiguus TaxID=176160 RepID=UPI003CCD4051
MKFYLVFCLLVILVAAGTVTDNRSSDLAVNVTELNDLIAAIKVDVLDLNGATADDVTIDPANSIPADTAGPCNRKCKGPGSRPCCPKDTCFMDVCIGPHLGPNEFPDAFNAYAQMELNRDAATLDKRDPKCRRGCVRHTDCCRTDLCILRACLGRHEDHPGPALSKE